jgi:hypothetical protein
VPTAARFHSPEAAFGVNSGREPPCEETADKAQ